MKRTLMILILIMVWSVSNGQLYPPVQPYNESGYSHFQFEKFTLNRQSELSMNYSDTLFSVVVNFLKETSLYDKYVKDLSIRWIFDPSRTWSEHRVYDGFWNSHQSRDGKNVEWYWDKSHFDGMIMVLHLENYELDLAKTICMNIVNVPYKKTGPTEISIEEIISPPNNSNWEFQEPKRIQEPNLYLPPVKEEKKIKVGPFVIGGVALAGLVVGGIVLANYLNNDSGAGTSQPNTNPNTGHPGGSPPTTGFIFSFGFH